MNKFERLKRKKLRKPSFLKSAISNGNNGKWWKFGLSEVALTKTKTSLAIVLTAIGIVSALLTALRIYANDEPTFKRYADRLFAWHYETDRWTGYFSSFIEGVVDQEEMNLSRESTMTLALQAVGNSLDGGMSEKKLCGIFPAQDYKLVRGTISHFGKSAEIQIFEFVGGRVQVYAEFYLHQDGMVIEVKPKRNSTWFGNDTVRLGQHPDPELSIEKAFEKMHDACKDEKDEWSRQQKETFERLVEEGVIKRRSR